MQNRIKPFVKWAGGKGSLLNQLNNYYPIELKNGEIECYIEPFLGGGAVLIDILQNYRVKEAYTFDINIDLINSYNIIKNNVNELISNLKLLEKEYLNLEKEDRREYFYNIRKQYNSYRLVKDEMSLKRATEFIFLNRTCFNGLYRVNKNGDFNVPIGDYKNPSICDEENLIVLSELIKNVNFEYGDYKTSQKYIKKNTFVYFDPPYRPLNVTSGFTSYTKEDFDDENQKELALYYKELNNNNVKVMLSNSNPKNTNKEDCFFENIYKGFNINEVYAKRMINANSSGRGEISELLITNYETDNPNYGEIECINDGITCSGGKMVSVNKGETIMYLEMDYNKLSEIFVNNLLETNRGFDFYVNWENAKAYKEFEVELNAMNVLIKTNNIKEKFYKLVEKLPTVIATFPLLFALSKNERTEVWNGKNLLSVVGDEIANDENLKFSFEVEKLKQGLSKEEIEDYYYFFERIGLKNLCENLAEKSLIDYVIGVLVGLDSNGRKNRGGTAFEDACEPVIKKICEKYNVIMLSQKQFKKLKEYGFSISEDIANRKADFILIKDNKALNIEVDYFFRGGSKPEEIIDSYINRQHDLDKLNIGFVLLTDGLCWDNKSKSQLQKGFRNMNYLMNFYLAKNGMLEEVIGNYFK